MVILEIILARSAGEALAGGIVQGLMISAIFVVIYLISNVRQKIKSKSIIFEPADSIDSGSGISPTPPDDTKKEILIDNNKLKMQTTGFEEQLISFVTEDNDEPEKPTSEIVEFSDKYDKLRFIKKLLDDNILISDEFEREKKKILQDEPSIIVRRSERLLLIKKLLDDEIFTQGEFNREKQKILDNKPSAVIEKSEDLYLIKKLLDNDILTQEEFNIEKQKILKN